MIEKFRKASESWIVRGFFLFMAVAFAIMWGGGDFATRFGSSQQTVITVGHHKITNREFAEALNRQIHQLQLRTGQNIDEEIARKLGLYELIRDRLIQETLLELEAERLGLYVSDEYVREHIKKDPFFQGENGKFDKKRFEFLISRIGYDEPSYVDALRQDLMRERLVDALTGGVNTPLAMAIPLYLWQNEQRQISTVTIDSQNINIAEQPTMAQLKDFFKNNQTMFQAPEYRDITAVIVDVESLKAGIHVSEEEIKAAYDARQREFEGKALKDVKDQIIEELKKQKATDQLQQLITQVEDAVGAGNSLQEIAQKYNLERKIFKHRDATGQSDPFGGNDTGSSQEVLRDIDRTIIKEAFNLEAETISSLIDAGNGRYFIARVDAIQAAHPRTFEQVQSKLAHFWRVAEQIKRAQNQAQELVNAVHQGVPLTAAAGKFNLKALGSRISRHGAVAPSVIQLTPEAIERLFNTPKNKATAFVTQKTQEGAHMMVAAVHTIERPSVPSDPQELDKMRSKLRDYLVNDILSLYVFSLRKRFPVEINKRFFPKTG
jgi:peptidyl-prolyl cis-trans isomerase D